jgi:hypothetical protein
MKPTQATIYLSGAITSDPHYLLKFQRAEDMFARFGMNVINPCKLEHREGATQDEYLRKDISEMVLCDAVYVMRDWVNSLGAQTEIKVANILNIKVLFAGTADFNVWMFCRFTPKKMSKWVVAPDGAILENIEL